MTKIHSPSLQLSLGALPRQPAPPALSALQDHPLPGPLEVRGGPGIERRGPDISPSVTPTPSSPLSCPQLTPSLSSSGPPDPPDSLSYPIAFKPPITLEAREAILSLNEREQRPKFRVPQKRHRQSPMMRAPPTPCKECPPFSPSRLSPPEGPGCQRYPKNKKALSFLP